MKKPRLKSLSRDLIPLLGAALGDALGAGVEGGRALERALREDAAAIGRRFLPYSPFGFEPGEVTDDTQMAWAAVSAARGRSSLPPPDADDPAGILPVVGNAYRAWLASRPPDVGSLTRGSLTHQGDDGGFRAWGGESAGNGSLMRATWPFAAGYRGEDLLRAAALDSALTHADPRCVAACVWYVAVIERAMRADDPGALSGAYGAGLAALEAAPVPEWLEPLGQGVPSAWSAFLEKWSEGRMEIAKAVGAALAGEHVDCARTSWQEWPTGFVVSSLRQAAWAALQGAAADEAVRLAVLHGGRDADTIGAIAGGLVGARFGTRALRQWDSALLASLRMGHTWPGMGATGTFLEMLQGLGTA